MVLYFRLDNVLNPLVEAKIKLFLKRDQCVHSAHATIKKPVIARVTSVDCTALGPLSSPHPKAPRLISTIPPRPPPRPLPLHPNLTAFCSPSQAGLSKFAKLARSVTRSRSVLVTQFSSHLPAMKDVAKQSNITHVSAGQTGRERERKGSKQVGVESRVCVGGTERE